VIFLATFIAVYRGKTVGEAEIIAVSADPHLVAQVTAQMLEIVPDASGEEPDPALTALRQGRHRALHIIRQEAIS
jgi:hypothetical protein